MQIAMSIAAAAIILLVLWDAFITVFSSNGGGPLTNLWTQAVWTGLTAIHRRRAIHRLLAACGPLMLVSVILVWHLVLSAGWYLLFSAFDDTVIVSETKTSANALQELYFIGTTVTSVGYGDLVPARFPWTIWSNIAAITATILLTTSLSYVIAVLAAGIERKYLAEAIFALGETPMEFVQHACGPRGTAALESYILKLASDIDRHAHQHLSYPILHFFHSASPRKSPGRAVLLFSDALFLIGHAVAPGQRPAAGVLQVANRSIANYAELTRSGIIFPHHLEEVPTEHLSVNPVEQAGMEAVSDEAFQPAREQYLDRRRRLRAICHEDGWPEVR